MSVNPFTTRLARLSPSLGILFLVVGCSTEPNASTELILLNGNRVLNLHLQVTPPSGNVQTFELPAGDVTGEPFGPALRQSYQASVGQTFQFTATVGTLSATKSCTTTERMIEVAGDESTGFAVVGVYAVVAQSTIQIECNW